MMPEGQVDAHPRQLVALRNVLSHPKQLIIHFKVHTFTSPEVRWFAEKLVLDVALAPPPRNSQ